MSTDEQELRAIIHEEFEKLNPSGRADWIAKNWWQVVGLLVLVCGWATSYANLKTTLSSHMVAPYHDGMHILDDSETRDKLTEIQVDLKYIRQGQVELKARVLELQNRMNP